MSLSLPFLLSPVCHVWMYYTAGRGPLLPSKAALHRAATTHLLPQYLRKHRCLSQYSSVHLCGNDRGLKISSGLWWIYVFSLPSWLMCVFCAQVPNPHLSCLALSAGMGLDTPLAAPSLRSPSSVICTFVEDSFKLLTFSGVLFSLCECGIFGSFKLPDQM